MLTYDIILFTECRLQNEAELTVIGYEVRLLLRKKARCTQGGGIAVLIREEICQFITFVKFMKIMYFADNCILKTIVIFTLAVSTLFSSY